MNLTVVKIVCGILGLLFLYNSFFVVASIFIGIILIAAAFKHD